MFTIIIGISLITYPYSTVFAQATGTTSVPTANFTGVVTKVIDGDTLDVKTIDGKTIAVRLALVDAPETNEPGYTQASNFVSQNCLNKAAEVDPDNNQGLSFGRLVAVVYCDDLNINDLVIASGLATIYKSFCDISEFANTTWAQKYGCGSGSGSGTTQTTQSSSSSSSSSDSTDKVSDGKQLQLDISIAKNPIVRGNIQTITTEVSDAKSKIKVSGASIEGKITYTTGHIEAFKEVTDSSGKSTYPWKIGPKSNPGKFTIDVKASANEYDSVSKSTTFQVIEKPTVANITQQNSTIGLQGPILNQTSLTSNTTNIDLTNSATLIDGNGTIDNDIKPITGCPPNQNLENGQCIDISKGQQLDSVCQPNDLNCPKPVCPPTGCEKGSDPITQSVPKLIDVPVTGIVEDFETEEIGNNDGESPDEDKTFGFAVDDETTDSTDVNGDESTSDVNNEGGGDIIEETGNGDADSNDESSGGGDDGGDSGSDDESSGGGDDGGSSSEE